MQVYRSDLVTKFTEYESDVRHVLGLVDIYKDRTVSSKIEVIDSIEAACKKAISFINKLKSELVEDATDHLDQQLADYDAYKNDIGVTFIKVRDRVSQALDNPKFRDDVSSELDIAMSALNVPTERVVSFVEQSDEISKSDIGIIVSHTTEPPKPHPPSNVPLKEMLHLQEKHSSLRLPFKLSLEADDTPSCMTSSCTTSSCTTPNCMTSSCTTSSCTTPTLSPGFKEIVDSSTPRHSSIRFKFGSNTLPVAAGDGHTVNDTSQLADRCKLLESAERAWCQMFSGEEGSGDVSQAAAEMDSDVTEMAPSMQTTGNGDSNVSISHCEGQLNNGVQSEQRLADEDALVKAGPMARSDVKEVPNVRINFSSLSLNSPTIPPIRKYISSASAGPLQATLSLSIGAPKVKLSFPIGACLYQSGVVVCNSGDGRVLHVSLLSPHDVTQLNANFSRPSAVVVDESTGVLYVKDDKCIRSFGSDMQVIRQFPSAKRQLYGLVLQKDRLLTMIDCGNGRGVPQHPALLKYSLVGDLLSVTPLTLPLVSLTKLRFMDVSGDNLYISDLGASCVYWVSVSTGILVKVIATHGKQPGFFREPSGIACDSQGNILIADSRSNRVQVFDGVERTYVGLLDCGQVMVRPSAICLIGDNQLLAVNYLGRSVNIYDLVV